MVVGRKSTGGKYKTSRKTKKYERPGLETKVKLRERKTKIIRGMGGNLKTAILSENKVNLINPKTKKSKKVAIKNVLETPSNRFLARQNVLVKSAIIETELGKARITNRPSREGMVQAVLIE